MTPILHNKTSVFDLLPESRIDIGDVPYILKRITRGGMGCVFLLHKDFNSPYKRTIYGPSLALKVMLPGVVDEITEKLYKRELTVWAGFRHPNIVRLIDIANGGNDGWIAVMDWHKGSLREIIQNRKSLSFIESSNIIISIINGLKNAYSIDNILHLDLKPENILYDGPEKIKFTSIDDEFDEYRFMIADWGICSTKNTSIQAQGLIKYDNNTLNNIGTINYMSPERFIKDYPSSMASDVYSLGIIYLEILTGSLPYQNSNDTIDSIKSGKYMKTADSLLKRGDIPRQTRNLVMEMISPHPENRPKDYAEIGKAITSSSWYENNILGIFRRQ